MKAALTRREILGAAVLAPVVVTGADATNIDGVDRITVLPGKTWLRPPKEITSGTARWTKVSGPGPVRFENASALNTTARFSKPGPYVLRLTVEDGQATKTSTLNVSVEPPPPPKQLSPVYATGFRLDSKFWNPRVRALIVNWIPHCIDIINRDDVTLGQGGIDNFIEAGKRLRGEPAGLHKGYVFSNAWVHQTVEAMCIALMIDPQGDPEILKAHERFRATLEDWIPKILAAQEPDGYLQTAFTLDREDRRGTVPSSKFGHWDPKHRGDHEGYVAGYFLEAAINHYQMTGRRDARLYNAAKKLANCWDKNLGPSPKKAWYDGHQQMEQGLVRFGRFVNEVEGGGRGDRYIQLAKFLLDSRYTAAVDPKRDRSEYDQSHLPVVEQYEAVGHAVRAVYTYSGMADVAVETHDPDYRSAVRSLWDNIVNKKYYLTGGIGAVGRYEGFGPNYALDNNGYCEACSSCGMIFFHWKMNLAYRDAHYVDNYEETIYNALLGSVDLDGKYFYYTNPLDGSMKRSSWHQCPCCVGNIPRTLLMFPTWMYATAPDGVYVNLYAGSTIRVRDDLEIAQQTDYPWDGRIALTVNPKTRSRFTLRLRIPNRATSRLYAAEPAVRTLTALRINGKPVKATIDKGYAVLAREWAPGDRVELELPMPVQRVRSTDQIAATRSKTALRYGPLVYNVEAVDTDITKPLPDDAPLKAEWRAALLGGVMAITDGKGLTAVPNYARLNRNKELPPEGGPNSAEPALYTGGAKPVPPEPRKRPRPVVSAVWIPAPAPGEPR